MDETVGRHRRARIRGFVVAGPSMRPGLEHGDRIVATPIGRRVRRGWRCVVEHPERPGFWLVKRIGAGPGEGVPGSQAGRVVPPGHLYVLSDDPAPEHVDSRTFGPVPMAGGYRVRFRLPRRRDRVAAR
ncbi:MAG: S26 family signal peptidase [Ilumatobacteraceae bacterium]